jgi:hypothetical protein
MGHICTSFTSLNITSLTNTIIVYVKLIRTLHKAWFIIIIEDKWKFTRCTQNIRSTFLTRNFAINAFHIQSIGISSIWTGRYTCKIFFQIILSDTVYAICWIGAFEAWRNTLSTIHWSFIIIICIWAMLITLLINRMKEIVFDTINTLCRRILTSLAGGLTKLTSHVRRLIEITIWALLITSFIIIIKIMSWYARYTLGFWSTF